jgi:L-ascorbate metabolism protein UlaG (beta-lactamase superfamily)
VKIKWLGHASFLITSEKGTRIITDPYNVGGPIKYGAIKETADVVTVSHEHSDHNNVASIGGKPQVFKGGPPIIVKDVKLTSIPTYHDENKGRDRGPNLIICMEMDGLRLCHLGDLGHPLSAQEITLVGKVDILLIPVGGFFTVTPAVASDVAARLRPKAVIPMHYKNEKCGYPIAGVDEFLKNKENVNRINGSEVEFKADKLPNAIQVIVLQPAL